MKVNDMILLMAEIRRSPVEAGSLSHYLQGFSTIPGGWEWDFSHQQYDMKNRGGKTDADAEAGCSPSSGGHKRRQR